MIVQERFIVLVAEFIISLDQSNESLVTSSLFVQDDIKSTKTLQPHLSTRFKTITRLYFHEKFRKLANITICLSRDHRFTQHQRCKLVIPRIIVCPIFSTENHFVGGTKAGHVAIFHRKCIKNSVKLFEDRRERQNATLVQYANGCIYAITKNHSLICLDMNLQVQKVFGHRIDGDVNILAL